jgi:cyclophilin family peptidyl-prolyl cis-trans isomerase/HEAT repeat protein
MMSGSRLSADGTFVIACLLLWAVWGSREGVAASIPPAIVQITAWEDQRASSAELLAFLADSDAVVRARTALALGRIGRAADVPALTPLLQDPEAVVRRNAAFALGEIEDSTAAVPLARMLVAGKEPDATVRALAVEGLGKLRREPEACRVCLSDPSPEVRMAAILAAWQIPVPGVLAEVLRLSESDEAEIRWRAAYCIMRLAGAPASGKTAIPSAGPLAEADRGRVGERLRRLLSDSDLRVRQQAARGLSTFADSATTRALLGLFRDPDWRVRVESIRALAAPHTRQVGLSLLEPHLTDPNQNVRITLIEALAYLGTDEEVLPRLRSLARDPEPRIRQVAYGSTLARYGAKGKPLPADAVAAVEAATGEVLAAEDWTLRVLAADGAALLPPEKARPVLQTMIRDEPRVAKAAVEPLLRQKARDGTGDLLARLQPELKALAEAQDPVLRTMAIGALGAIFSDSTLAPMGGNLQDLESLLEEMCSASARGDSSSDVRLAVIEVAATRTERAGMRRLLTECCHDPEYIVRREAAAALRKAGLAPPREPEPVETGRGPDETRAILEWAQRDHWALIETQGGEIALRLFSQEAPLTCWNFAELARAGFFDHGHWHRVVPDFVLQDGCPRGDGYGGSAREIRCEINRQRYLAGTLGMALSGKDTGSSQFFITHSCQPHLDGRYTVFGRIEKGQDQADDVTQGADIRTIRVIDQAP